MNRLSTTQETGLEYLEELASEALADGPLLPRQAVRDAVAELCQNLEQPVVPDDLLARPCPAPAAVWHWQQIERLLEDSRGEALWSAPRLAFHARWVLSLLSPARPDAQPLISVIVPVYNRAKLVCEAVDSALAQTYRRVEVIVVDDGSTDTIAEAMRAYRGRIQFVRQPNRGVSSARNHGLRLATGQYVNCLDSDNLLDPDAFARQIEACRAVADAEICYSPVRREDEVVGGLPFMRLPDGGPDCPTTDLMETVVDRHPFAMLGVLMPRWLLLEVGGFEERMRRGEDTRLWFHLGVRGTKVIGLTSRRSLCRPQPTGLTFGERPDDGLAREALLSFLDVIECPDRWSYLPLLARRLTLADRWLWIGASDEPLILEARECLLSLVERLGGRDENAVVDTALSELLHAIQAIERKVGDLGEARPFHDRAVALLSDRVVRGGC